jgi:hypothetical protein
MHIRTPIALAGLLAIAALSLSACGSDSKTTASSGPSTSAVGASTTTAPPADVPLTGAATTPTSAPPQSGPKAFLTAVRADAHSTYDRVVFEFDGPAPGYAATYVTDPLTNEDSGAPIPINGSSVLKLAMKSAASADVGVIIRDTYTGPDRFTPPGTPVVAELVQVSDFEGTLTWAIGLRREAPFKVQTLSSPSRLVIDFQS